MKNIIIFTHGGGRFANQLTNFAHFIAFIKQENYSFINIAFNNYSELLDNYKKSDIVKYNLEDNELNSFYFLKFLLKILNFSKHRIYTKLIIRLLHFYTFSQPKAQSIRVNSSSTLKFLTGKEIGNVNFSDKSSMDLFAKKKITIIAGWTIRDWYLLEKNSAIVRENLIFNEKYQQISNDFINNIRKEKDILIGVSIRQTDFKIYANGKYYLTTEEYINLMKKLNERYANKKLALIVSSDESKNIKDFGNLPVYFTTGIMGGSGHYIESFIQLAMCDYVLTVPSTFGCWASFMGNSKIIPVYDKNELVAENKYFNNNIFDCFTDNYYSEAIR